MYLVTVLFKCAAGHEKKCKIVNLTEKFRYFIHEFKLKKHFLIYKAFEYGI